MTMKYLVRFGFLSLALAACSPQPALRLNIEIHRSDLTSIEVVRKTIGSEASSVSCRIYRSDNPDAPADACEFEDGVDTWNGEKRDETTPLSFIWYGEAATKLEITIAGYVDGKMVARETKGTDGTVTLGDGDGDLHSVSFVMMRQTEIHRACEYSFPAVAAADDALAENTALSLVKNSNGGFDVVTAVNGTLRVHSYSRSASDDDCLSEVGSIQPTYEREIPQAGSTPPMFETVNIKCFVRPDQLVVGNMNDTPEEEILGLCQPQRIVGNPNQPIQRNFPPVAFIANADMSDLFYSEAGPQGIAGDNVSPFVLGPSPAMPSRFRMYALNARTSSAANPFLELRSLAYGSNTQNGDYRLEAMHRFTETKPVFECPAMRPLCTSAPPACGDANTDVAIIENGCWRCDKRANYLEPRTNPVQCNGNQVPVKKSSGNQNQTWKCIPKSQCLWGDNFIMDNNQIFQRGLSASYPPLPYEENGEQKLVIAGYPRGLAYWSKSKGMTDNQINGKSESLRSPVLVRKDNVDYLLEDELVSDSGSIMRGRINKKVLSDLSIVGDATFPATKNILAARQLSYAVGTSTSTFVLAGDSFVRNTNEQSAASIHLDEIDLFNVSDMPPGTNGDHLLKHRRTYDEYEGAPDSGPMSIRLADIDTNEGVDIIAFHPKDNRIFAFRTDDNGLEPKLVTDFPLEISDREGDLLVLLADLDRDGRIEFVVLDQQKLRIYSLGLNSYKADNMPWPMARRDRQNRAYYTSSSDPL